MNFILTSASGIPGRVVEINYMPTWHLQQLIIVVLSPYEEASKVD